MSSRLFDNSVNQKNNSILRQQTRTGLLKHPGKNQNMFPPKNGNIYNIRKVITAEILAIQKSNQHLQLLKKSKNNPNIYLEENNSDFTTTIIRNYISIGNPTTQNNLKSKTSKKKGHT